MTKEQHEDITLNGIIIVFKEPLFVGNKERLEAIRKRIKSLISLYTDKEVHVDFNYNYKTKKE